MASTKSAAWATSQRLPDLLVGGVGLAVAEVAGDRAAEQIRGFCGTSPMWCHSRSGSASRTSTPPTSTLPAVASNRRATRLISVVFPEPVLPMTATVWPGTRLEGDVVNHRRLGPGIGEADVPHLEGSGRPELRTGLAGGATEGWVSSTSWIRSPLTAARGASTATKVVIMTAIRISVK